LNIVQGCRPTPRELCDAIECESCVANTVAALPIIKNNTLYWTDQNEKAANRVMRGSQQLCYLECRKHNPPYQFEAIPKYLNGGGGCPRCCNKTEDAILHALEVLGNYTVIRQHRFEGLLCNTRQFRFDAYIDSLKLIVEVFLYRALFIYQNTLLTETLD
jgi:hypothetical protein